MTKTGSRFAHILEKGSGKWRIFFREQHISLANEIIVVVNTGVTPLNTEMRQLFRNWGSKVKMA